MLTLNSAATVRASGVSRTVSDNCSERCRQLQTQKQGAAASGRARVVNVRPRMGARSALPGIAARPRDINARQRGDRIARGDDMVRARVEGAAGMGAFAAATSCVMSRAGGADEAFLADALAPVAMAGVDCATNAACSASSSGLECCGGGGAVVRPSSASRNGRPAARGDAVGGGGATDACEPPAAASASTRASAVAAVGALRRNGAMALLARSAARGVALRSAALVRR